MLSNGEAMRPGSVDESLTVPCEGIGVWIGACVVHADGRAGVVVATGELAGQPGAWVAFAVGINSVPEPGFHLAQELHLDLTHRMTRLEAMARLGARSRVNVGSGMLWFRLFARYTWVIDGAAGASASWSPEEDGDASFVPALAGLDPTDDAHLPDGAKLFDVRALAIVLRHVFGREVKP